MTAPDGHITWSGDTHAYVACCYGANGDEPGDCYTRHGKDEAGLWWVDDGDESSRLAPAGPYETQSEAIDAAEALAASQHEGKDAEDAEDVLLRTLKEQAGEPDPNGSWCVYWEASENGHVVDRYGSPEAAEAATDLANRSLHERHPGVHLLCGHEVRELVDGRWVRITEEES